MTITVTPVLIVATIIVAVLAVIGTCHLLTWSYSRARLWIQPYYRAPKHSLRAHFLGQVINR